MHLGVVTTSYPQSRADSAGAFVAEHVTWLRSRGARVDVVAAGQCVFDPRGVPAGGGQLFYTGGAPERLETNLVGSIAPALEYGVRLWREVRRRRHRWDGVIAHWLVPAAIAALAAPRLPLTAIGHSGDVDLLCRTRLASPVALLLRRRRANLVFVAAHLRERMAATVVPPLRSWVRTRPVQAMGLASERTAQIPPVIPPRARPRVVFIGRLVEIKGVRTLLQAAPAIASAADVIIAGGGPLAEDVSRSQASGAVRALGWIDSNERDELLRGADVVVIPSIQRGRRVEGAPRVALEAMSAGAPLVVSRTGGLAELPPGVAARVEPGNPTALAEMVLGLLRDPSRRARMRERGTHFAASQTWARVGATFDPPGVAGPPTW